VKALKAILALLGVLLVVALAFASGYLTNELLHPDRVDLNREQREKAREAGDLQQRIIEELQGRYYKKVDVDKLEGAGADGALKALDDPYTVYMDPKETKDFDEETSGKYSGIGVVLDKKGQRLLIQRVMPGSPAEGAGLQPGDAIVTVDGQPTVGEPTEVNISRIKGPEGTEVKLVIDRPGRKRPVRVTITRRQIAIPMTETKMIERDGVKVGYIQLYEFSDGVGKTVRKEIDALEKQGARWIILDLRFNPGGLVDEAINVTSDFLEDGLIVTTEGLHSPREKYDAEGDAATGLPLVVLVNRWSASASEITAGALKGNDRATLVGTRTFGKGLVQSIVDLPDGATLKLTTAIYLTPDGHDINKKGIQPDIKAPDKPKTKADETLDAALEFIANGR